MTTKIVNSIKYIAIFSIVLMSIIACEKDFQNVGVGLVDNDLFTTKKETFEVISYNHDVSASRISSNNPHLLGVTKDETFGLLKASIIGQLSLGTINFTDNMSIDAVILDIPYYATKLDDNSNNTPNFESQEAIEQYFKGLYIQATGSEGSLLPFKINVSDFNLKPSIEVRYTKTVLKGGTTVVDTIEKSNSFLLSNFSASVYKMNEKSYPNNGNIILQGTAGNMAQVKLLAANELTSLKNKNWLVNDASLTFYVNQNITGTDTIVTPYKLFLYKDGNLKSKIKDIVSEGPDSFGGNLVINNNKPDYYTFKITDYISDLLSGESNYNPILGLKVLNSSDVPTTATDTLVTNYSWNPKVVTLLNHSNTNGARKARLKISYSIKK